MIDCCGSVVYGVVYVVVLVLVWFGGCGGCFGCCVDWWVVVVFGELVGV